MKTEIDIRICYEIEGNEANLKLADSFYKDFQDQFKKLFPNAKLYFSHIAKSDIKRKSLK